MEFQLATFGTFILQQTRYGKTIYDEAVNAKQGMENVGANILGAVMNDIPIDAEGGGYYYYSYGEEHLEG